MLHWSWSWSEAGQSLVCRFSELQNFDVNQQVHPNYKGRIVVGSRPANSSHWQWMPVQTMERFGYTPRVLTRVLNFGTFVHGVVSV